MGLFIRFIPWITSSELISKLVEHNLSNDSPPSWAQSFAINHGEAMYYKESVPSEEPIFTALVVLSFVAVILSGSYFNKKNRQNEGN